MDPKDQINQQSTTGQPPESTDQNASAAASQTDDWQAILEKVDPKELAKHPKVSGLVGSLAERQAKKLAAQQRLDEQERDRQNREADEARRLATLRDTNPLQYVEEQRKLDERRAQGAATQSELQALAEEIMADLPEEIQDKVARKTYPGTARQGFRAFLAEVRDLQTEHVAKERADAELSRREKDLRETIRKELLAEANGGEPPPDVGNGTASGTKRFTLADIEKMSAAEYAKNRKEILALLG